MLSDISISQPSDTRNVVVPLGHLATLGRVSARGQPSTLQGMRSVGNGRGIGYPYGFISGGLRSHHTSQRTPDSPTPTSDKRPRSDIPRAPRPARTGRETTPRASYTSYCHRAYIGNLYMQSMCGMKTLTGTTLHCNIAGGSHLTRGFRKSRGANCRFRRGPVGVCVTC